MITSFKLPDLVLGVNIRADVTGARAAARQLRNAVASEFARAGGMGAAGIGAAGGAGGVGGAVLAGSAVIAQSVSGLNTQLDAAIASLNAWKQKVPGAPKEPTGEPFDAASFINPNFGKRGGGMRAGQGKGSWQNQYERVASMGLVYNRAIRVWVPAVEKATNTATAKGTQTGLLKGLRKALRLWHFLIGGLIVGAVVGGVKGALSPALQYIRNTGTTGGRYGAFAEHAGNTPSALRNVRVQFGLMAIQLLELDQVCREFNHILVQLGSAFEWLGKQSWLKRGIEAQKYSLWNLPWTVLWRALQYVPGGTGGTDLGSGNRMGFGGGALEGSVEAYRTIQGRMMDYAAQTARNTAEMSAAMQKILDRGPAMGVVNP
jgi:hypothetical protein